MEALIIVLVIGAIALLVSKLRPGPPTPPIPPVPPIPPWPEPEPPPPVPPYPPMPADIRIVAGSMVISPGTFYLGGKVTIKASVKNYGDSYGEKDIVLSGDLSGTQTAKLAAGATWEISFVATPTETKTYHIALNGEIGSFMVMPLPASVSGTVMYGSGIDLQGIEAKLNGSLCITNVEGVFHFSNVAADYYTLSFTCPQGHFLPKSLPINLVAGQKLNVGYVYLERAPVQDILIHGAVTGADTGMPIPSAPLSFPGYGGHPGVLATADKSGYYEVKAPTGRYCPVFRGTAGYPKYYPSGDPSNYIEFTQDTEYDFVVPPAPPPPPPPPPPRFAYGYVYGKETDVKEKLVGARVEICRYSTQIVGQVLANGQGIYEVPFSHVPEGYYYLRAYHPEWGYSKFEGASFKKGATVRVDLFIWNRQ